LWFHSGKHLTGVGFASLVEQIQRLNDVRPPGFRYGTAFVAASSCCRPPRDEAGSGGDWSREWYSSAECARLGISIHRRPAVRWTRCFERATYLNAPPPADASLKEEGQTARSWPKVMNFFSQSDCRPTFSNSSSSKSLTHDVDRIAGRGTLRRVPGGSMDDRRWPTGAADRQ
jgi:hypothetical protein